MIEWRTLHMLEAVKRSIGIPVAVKLSPFYTSLSHFAHRLAEHGVNGLILFNRFYQPDIDVETLEVAPTLRLSDSSELLLRLRWLAILSGAHQGLAGGHRRHPLRARRREGGDGGGRLRADRLHPPEARPRSSDQPAPRPRPLAGGARVRIAGADEGEHESAALPQPRSPRTGELHVDLAELVGVRAGPIPSTQAARFLFLERPWPPPAWDFNPGRA